ncbi:MAG: pyridoxamine 5'-phosphate oxidase [Chlamydiales bacterium]
MVHHISYEKLRVEYGNCPFEEKTLNIDPLQQFTHWFQEAVKADVFEPNGMALATVSPVGQPCSRIVLLKKLDQKGFIFFTNYTSRKGEQLAHSPRASLTFWWREIFRQVSIEGVVKKVSRKLSREYFAKRPRGAQIAATLSTQSKPIVNNLQQEFREFQKKCRGKEIACPTTWGGYRLLPERIEFWQGRKNRLHDRFLYVKTNGSWVVSRLAP